MKRSIRIALGTAAVAAALTVAGASPAQAQVRFSGSFPLPHGRISIGIGDPFFSVGSYVPYDYTVIEDPNYGYGFWYRDRWIPTERIDSSWVVCERPYFGGAYVSPGYDYYRPYVRSYRPYAYGGHYRRYDRWDGRYDRDRRFDRWDGRSDRGRWDWDHDRNDRRWR